MADLRAYQPSFTAGELSPALWARVDLSKYATGLKTALNLFIHAHGGASNRAGFEFIGEVFDSSKLVRLIPFEFNTEQTYMLEFGDQYMRVYRDGGVIIGDGGIYAINTPYSQYHVGELVFVQEADVMYICHPDYPVYKLSRFADDDWRLTALTFQPRISSPSNVTGTARYKFRNGDNSNYGFRVTALGPTGLQSAPSASIAVTNWQYENFDGRFIRVWWDAVPGAVSYRVYRVDGVTGIVAETPDTSADMPQGPGTFNGDGTPLPSGDPGAPAAPTNVMAGLVFGKPYKYVVAAVDDESGEESLPSAPVTLNNEMSIAGNRNTLTWDAVPGASSYTIYREDNGVYGYIGRSETTTFTDENIVPDLADGPQEGRNPFNAAGKYPRSVTFVEQRLAFASTRQEPQAVWLSQSGNYENFNVATPAKASDAVTFRIRARQVNEIRSMLPIRGLMLLTSGAEWIVSGGSQSDAITPTAIKIDNQGFRGASRVQPIVVGNIVLFAQERGGVIRDFSYEFANDAFVGKDLTILARHLFENKSVKAWAYSQAPYSIVWVVMNDGSLISLTYMKEHDVWAWTRHDSSGGYFEDVSVIAEGGEDVPYFIVRRTINGQVRRYIERLHTRNFASVEDAFFVDSGLTYAGPPVSIILGLDHLLGEEVVALADGNVVRDLVVGPVDGGIGVVLPYAASKVHVGLPYEATLQTLDLDLGQVQGLGTVQGRKKSISELVLRVENTRGIWIGPHERSLVEYKQRSTEAWNEAIRLYTGDINMTPEWDWTDGGNVWVKQKDPLPMTILALMPDVTIGR